MPAFRYTFLSEYRGGTYVAEITACNVAEAVDKWVEYLARVRPIPRVSGYLARSISAQVAGSPPVVMDGMIGVWCFYSHLWG